MSEMGRISRAQELTDRVDHPVQVVCGSRTWSAELPDHRENSNDDAPDVVPWIGKKNGVMLASAFVTRKNPLADSEE